jgi:hypothetical protein
MQGETLMARSRNVNPNRKLQRLVREPNLFRRLLHPLEHAVRHVISVDQEQSWFPQFPVLAHLLCGIYFHLAQCASLRGLLTVLTLRLQDRFLQGFSLRRATVSDANNSPRRLKVLRGVFAELVAHAAQVSRSAQNKLARFAALDSTLLRCVPSATWASFRRKVNACKAHLLLDLANAIPKKLILTIGRLHDRQAFLPFLQRGWTYIVDRAYNDYRVFEQMCQDGIFFVTRLKSNAQYRILRRRPVTRTARKNGLVADWEVRLGSGTTTMTATLRVVKFRAADGRVYHFLTNRLDLAATMIAHLYHARWAIEKFFKWLKRSLRMERGLARSEVGMEIHVLITLIADTLLKMLVGRLRKGFQHIPVVLLRIIHARLFARYSTRLLDRLQLPIDAKPPG